MATTPFPYHVLNVTSPMCFGGEDKNQDRASWCTASRTATVCDGVTSSPCSDRAAEIVTAFAPILFQGSIEERLHAVSDLLVAHRLKAQRSTFNPPANTPAAMVEMLRDAAKQQMRHAYQTTLVAAGFTPTDDAVIASVARCGDSVFLAYAPDGTILTASPSGLTSKTASENGSGRTERFRFGPGDQLLVKVKGSADVFLDLAESAGLSSATAHKWLVCSALDECGPKQSSSQTSRSSASTHWVSPDDLLLVPRHLTGSMHESQNGRHRYLRYSRLIRPVNGRVAPSNDLRFDTPGTATAVLPDHFYKRNWTHFEDRFTPDTHFLLASDGLTGCFSNPTELWNWLQTNESRLADASQRESLLHELHADRHARRSDDDISFVWLTPTADFNRHDHEEANDAG